MPDKSEEFWTVIIAITSIVSLLLILLLEFTLFNAYYSTFPVKGP